MLVGAPCVYQKGRAGYDDVLHLALGSLRKYKRCVINVGSCDKELISSTEHKAVKQKIKTRNLADVYHF